MGKETKQIVLKILGIFVISRLLILSIGYLSNLVIIKGRNYGAPTSFLDLFFRWDSGWYISIVKGGYYYIPGQESRVAFFPLYPMLIKFFSLIFGNPKLMGFIVSNVALFLAAIYLYKLIKIDFDENTAFKSVLYILIFPVSFFFSICYTEALFLCLAVSCFYYARKKQWLAASILGFFLSLTRSVGVLIIIPLIFEYLDIDFKNFKINKKKIKKDIFYLLLIPAGLLAYMSYLYIKFNDAFAFFHAQTAWNRRFTSIFTTLTNLHYSTFYLIIFVGATILALLLLIYLIDSKVRFSYIIYSALLFFVYLSSGLLESMPRYIGIIFPFYLGLALLANKNKSWDLFITSFSVMLLTLFTILFVNGYWFT